VFLDSIIKRELFDRNNPSFDLSVDDAHHRSRFTRIYIGPYDGHNCPLRRPQWAFEHRGQRASSEKELKDAKRKNWLEDA
jgi:hypothetical protein